MELSAFEWTIIGGVAALAIGVIGFFLKRTMSRVDKHDEDIHLIRREHARCETVDAQGKDINHIKQTYVTKAEVKEIKDELREDWKKVAGDVSEIKDKMMYKEDFYRMIVDVNKNIKDLRDVVIDNIGGKNHGL